MGASSGKAILDPIGTFITNEIVPYDIRKFIDDPFGISEGALGIDVDSFLDFASLPGNELKRKMGMDPPDSGQAPRKEAQKKLEEGMNYNRSFGQPVVKPPKPLSKNSPAIVLGTSQFDSILS